MLSCVQLFSQQLPQFSQYMFNTITINPAYAGSRETLSVVGLHRDQWVGLKGGPTTSTLSVHSPLRNDKIGVGLSIINDELGYENFLFAYGDFSYTIDVSPNTKLALGLKAGFTHYNLDQIGFDDDPDIINDPFFQNFTNRWNPNIGVGAFLHQNRWYIGLSAPRLLNTDYNQTALDADVDYVATERIGYFLTGGYVFNLNEKTKLKPSALLKATNGAPISYDISAHLLFNEKLWLGGSYRYNNDTATVGALTDFQVTPQIRIGYAYEHFISDLRPYTGGTHEIILMYEFFKTTKRVKSPRYF